MHPLSPDLTKLTDTELTEKIGTLMDRMSFYARTGHTASWQQLNNIYQDAILEQQERIAKNYITDKDQFGDLIDIKKI